MNINFDNLEKLTDEYRESTIYLSNNTIYKIYKPNFMMESRIDIINKFMTNHIEGCPLIYDLIYNDNTFLGYSMKYYKKTKPITHLSLNMKKKLCFELIQLFEEIKEKNELLYYDFHEGNVLENESNILLLDIDSCIKYSKTNNDIACSYLNDFILCIIYGYYRKYEIYLTSDERNKYSDLLYQNLSFNRKEKGNIKEIEDLIINIEEKDIKKLKKNLPQFMRY